MTLAATSCGREQWREADARLDSAATQARAAGFAPLSGPHNAFGDFTAPGSTTWRVHFEAHQSYFIAAACTSGCDSLDFAVVEPHGTESFADTSSGWAARLVFLPTEEGDYRVTFRYGRCATERCRWVAQVYGHSPSR